LHNKALCTASVRHITKVS